ncbi:katanin p60 ATPase-containing subunit A-like 2 isoform X2 [Triplophysa rosa]|uniref:katanin p60 ATPase-containing subunit A-like 2 isoform X2 n=1 Tax=Triplophysa rosa TaxID=992332 RepID=UPI002545E5F7|nr:katanin p60 ATPase-containing subunit A-like 2 isoform X2 [Triplophysa rosa]
MDFSYKAIKTANQAREARKANRLNARVTGCRSNLARFASLNECGAIYRINTQRTHTEELRTETRRRNLLVLIHHHLLEEGYTDAAKALEKESSVSLCRFEVCDNVDLDTVLMEYESYYYIKFQKYPKLTKKLPEQEVNRLVKSGGKRRTSSLSSQTLPRINSTRRPPSRNTGKTLESKLLGRDPSKHSSEIEYLSPAETSEFGLNVSPIHRNGTGEGTHMRKGHIIDYRNLIQDAVKGSASDSINILPCASDFSERLLKPITAFFGMNNEMRELAAVISRDIYLHNPNVCWDDIIGLEAAKRLVKEAVVYPIKYPQLFTGILSPWKGLLLYGPPGTGKTMLAKAVATECNTTFFNISASSIVSKWRGDSEKLVRVLFELARFHAPSTIFLDELESVMSQRGVGQGSEHEGSRRMKTELLVQMDGLARSNDLVFVLAASNLPWELDHAMLRRLEKRILVGLPSAPARQAMISHWLPPVSNTSAVELRTELDYNMLAQETEGYSGSDIRLVCKEAAMRPVRKIFDALENHIEGQSNMPVIELETVTTADFQDVIAHTKPSARCLTDRYSAWEREYESV